MRGIVPETNTLVCYRVPNKLSGSPTAHTVEWVAIREPIAATDINRPMLDEYIASAYQKMGRRFVPPLCDPGLKFPGL
jgi:hypothetical protein